MPARRHKADRVQQPVSDLPALRLDSRDFETEDVVSLDRIRYAILTRGPGALVEMEARRKPPILGQITEVDQLVVAVIWENGRLGLYSRDQQRVPQYTTSEVLILE